MIRILIVDDHAVVRSGLHYILSRAYPDVVCGEAGNARELLQALHEHSWDVVILDINMPGRTGLEVLEDLRQERPTLPVLVLSMHSESDYAMRALKAGAAGYLAKDSAPEELAQAVRQVLEGKRYVSPSFAQELAQSLAPNTCNPEKLPHQSLSDREYQVMSRLAAGKRVVEIADELCLSVQTVSTYRTRVLDKMKLKTIAELVRYVLDNQLIK